jgi:hypothetical protein
MIRVFLSGHLLLLSPQPESISFDNLVKFRPYHVLCWLILLFQHNIHLFPIADTRTSLAQAIRNIVEFVGRKTTLAGICTSFWEGNARPCRKLS